MEKHRQDSTTKVLVINKMGFWLMAYNEEYFLSFSEFPWFENAPAKAIFNVETFGQSSLRWPDLDVDLTMDGIKHPEKYPLKASTQARSDRAKPILSTN